MTTDPTFKVAISRYALDRKIPPGDPFWHDFNGSFSNSEVTAYDLAGAIWNGHPLTTWHKDHWRSTANFVTGQHLGLDFDTEDERSTLATLTADKFIAKHGAMCYTTPSHTDDKPKARAIFLLDTPIMQASNYALAAAALLWYYSAADRQCKDPARFFYGSKGCDFEMIDRVLPLETVKHMIQQYKETGRKALQNHTAGVVQTSDKYTTAALRNEVEAVRTAFQGTRNHTLNKACWNLARFIATGELSQIDIEDSLTSAALSVGLEMAETNSTLRSAINAATGAVRVQ